nr:hypothetical protein [Rhodococcus sp. (in: high G+C Gram-positive bacteria)]
MKQIANSCGNGLESREMAAALLAKDAFALQCLIVESIVDHGVPRTWRSVLRPLMDWSVSSGVDNVSEDSRMAPENSRMLTHCITSAMAVTMIESPAPNNMTRVVLTTVTGGSFDLEVRALGAALARESVDVAMVPGPDTIGPHAASIAALDAGVVVVWSTDPNDAVVPLLRAIRRRRPALQIFVAGRTSTAETLPRTVELLGGMESAVEAVVGAVTSEAGT